MTTKYKRRLEIYEAVRFVRINKQGDVPEFNHTPDWVRFALDNKIISIDGADLIWGYKELERKIKPGGWILRSMKTRMLKFKSDVDFQDQFEPHEPFEYSEQE